MQRIQLATVLAALLIVAISGTSLPAPSNNYDGCPPHTMEVCEVDRPKECGNSSVCSTGQKCCPISCNGLKCMPVEKPEQCMAHIMGCASDQPDPIDCNNDYDCANALKCCSTPCFGRTCQHPVAVDPPQGTRPGTCPDPKVMKIACDGSRVVEKCSKDNDCSAGKKCCQSPCGWTECFVAGDALPPPTHDYDGCPPHTMEACEVDRPKECESSSVCSTGQKCCPISCNGLKCMPVEKPGQCMAHILGCASDRPRDPIDCNNDYDCGDELKCCSTPCFGRTCQRPDIVVVDPPKPKAGDCKKVDWAALSCLVYDDEAKRFECDNDQSCPGSEKCCDNPCTEKRCREPEVKVGDGKCPDYSNIKVKCPAVEPTDDCKTDGECKEGKICCTKMCGGLGCLDPVKTPPLPKLDAPVCPVFDRKVVCKDKRSPYNCNPQDRCVNGGKCCEQECGGTQCSPGLCPAPDKNINCLLPESRDCESSSTCGEGQVCCEIHCGGTRCQSPVGLGYGGVGAAPKEEIKTAEGGPVCPSPAAKPVCSDAMKKRACQSDSECGSRKCCDTGCNVNICQTPVRPGSCPPLRDMSTIRCRAPTEEEKQNQCGTDMACPGGTQKCCESQCPGFGKVCKDSVY